MLLGMKRDSSIQFLLRVGFSLTVFLSFAHHLSRASACDLSSFPSGVWVVRVGKRLTEKSRGIAFLPYYSPQYTMSAAYFELGYEPGIDQNDELLKLFPSPEKTPESDRLRNAQSAYLQQLRTVLNPHETVTISCGYGVAAKLTFVDGAHFTQNSRSLEEMLQFFKDRKGQLNQSSVA